LGTIIVNESFDSYFLLSFAEKYSVINLDAKENSTADYTITLSEKLNHVQSFNEKLLCETLVEVDIMKLI